VAFRRGFVPVGESLSITQLEYQAALDGGIDVLAFLLDEDSPWPRKFDELERDPEVRAWRKAVEQRHGRGRFGLDPGSIEIGPAITRWVTQQSQRVAQVGEDWVHLVSNVLSLPRNEPETWNIAAGLLPRALETVEREYARLTGQGSVDPEPAAGAPESTGPTRSLVAGAREYFAEAGARYGNLCFVIQPFGSKPAEDGRTIDHDEVFRTIIAPAIQAATLPGGGSLEPVRADTDLLAGHASREKAALLEYARLVVADITGSNANVLYELGFRHRARGSGTVILREANSRVPFDLSAMRTISYDYWRPERVAECRARLTDVLDSLLRDPVPDNLLHDALRTP
jgi:hypothetical protein